MYIKLITNKDNQFLTFCQSQLKKKQFRRKAEILDLPDTEYVMSLNKQTSS